MQDAELAGNLISVEEIGKIFVMVNFETDKVSGAGSCNRFSCRLISLHPPLGSLRPPR